MQLDMGWATLELLPSAPYSINGKSALPTLGMAFARQRGVHAIANDRRQDFDAWPGDLALTLSDVPIFSESAHGGEYLLMHISDLVLMQELQHARPRKIFHGDQQAVQLAKNLRRLLLSKSADALAIEQQASQLLARGLALQGTSKPAGRYATERPLHAQVLEYIEAHLDSTISLEQLAGMSNMQLLRFLRSFTAATGCTPHAYITERRLQRARLLLQQSDLPLAAIAADCGFSHQSHLGAALKQRSGLSPQEYRRTYLKEK